MIGAIRIAIEIEPRDLAFLRLRLKHRRRWPGILSIKDIRTVMLCFLLLRTLDGHSRSLLCFHDGVAWGRLFVVLGPGSENTTAYEESEQRFFGKSVLYHFLSLDFKWRSECVLQDFQNIVAVRGKLLRNPAGHGYALRILVLSGRCASDTDAGMWRIRLVLDGQVEEAKFPSRGEAVATAEALIGDYPGLIDAIFLLDEQGHLLTLDADGFADESSEIQS